MPNFTLTQKQYEDLVHIFMVDNADIADHPEFFKESGLNPRKYLDERIALCNSFKIDFWNSVDLFTTSYHLQRLKALYNGQSIEDFEKQNKRPAPGESAKQILWLMENKEKILKRTGRKKNK